LKKNGTKEKQIKNNNIEEANYDATKEYKK